MSIEDVLKPIADFQRALGGNVETWKSNGLRASRVVTGENVTTYFRVLTPDASVVSIAKQFQDVKKRTQEAVSLRLVTTSQLDPVAKGLLEAGDIRVGSARGYFNDVLRSSRLCKETIADADAYIARGKYVDQRVREGSARACDHLRNHWLSDEGAPLAVVLASAGHGKTCLAYSVARMLADAHLQDETAPLPFFIPLHRHRHVREFEEMVLTHLEHSGVVGLTSQAFAYLANLRVLVPIVDGFDELAETGGLKVARKTFASLCGQFESSARVLLTSRQSFFRHRRDIAAEGQQAGILESMEVVDLEPFDAPERRKFFLCHDVPEKEVPRLERLVKSLGDDGDILGSPLMLWTIVMAERNPAPSEDTGDPGRLSGATLIDYCIRKVCEREMRRHAPPVPVDKQIALMSDLAYVMYGYDSYELERPDDWLRGIAEQETPADLPEDKREEFVEQQMLKLRQHAFLTPVAPATSREPDRLAFTHPFFRDYLLAQLLNSEVKNSNADKLAVYLRGGLPHTTIAQLGKFGDLVALRRIVLSRPDWGREFRPFMEMVLAKCDQASESDTDLRTTALHRVFGDSRDISYRSLVGLTFRALRFEGWRFTCCDFTESDFHSCTFLDCAMEGSLLSKSSFIGCNADQSTGQVIRERSERAVDLAVAGGVFQKLPGAKTQDDPVLFLLGRFLKRFVHQEHQNKRTREEHSLYQGLGGEEVKFTRRAILPAAESAKLVKRLQLPGRVIFEFNASWQEDADRLLYKNGELTSALSELVETLRKSSRHYSIS